MNNKITDRYVYLQEAIHDFMGLDLTQDQVLNLISENKELIANLDHYGYDSTQREKAMATIGKKLIGREHPSYGCDSTDKEPEAIQFYKELHEAAKQNNLKVRTNFYE